MSLPLPIQPHENLIDDQGLIVPKVLAIFHQVNSVIPPAALVPHIKETMYGVRHMMYVNRLKDVDWPAVFTKVGKLAINLLPEFDEQAFQTLLAQKSKAYGPGPIRSWGPLGVIIRIDSKIMRYENLKANANIESLGESLNDTMQDIVGYCVLGYLLVATT